MMRRILILGLFLLIVVFVYYLLKESGLLAIVTDSDRLQSWLVGLGYWGPVGIISLIAVAVVINPIPSAPIALASGAAFGHTWGTIYVVAGAGAGALGAFWIARLLGYELMKSVFGKHLKLGWMGSQNTLMAMVFVSRLIPFLSFDLVSYGAGLTPIKTWRFILATVAGLIPASFLLAHFGGELTAASLDEVLLTVLLLGGLTLVPVIINYTVRWRRRSAIDRINESSNRSPVIGKK